MRKLIVAFDRAPGTDTEEMREHYREEHAPIVRELPNLAGYEVTFAADPDRAPFDGVAQLSFADGAAMAEAMDSAAAARMQADAAEFLDTDSMVQFVGDEEGMLADDAG